MTKRHCCKCQHNRVTPCAGVRSRTNHSPGRADCICLVRRLFITVSPLIYRRSSLFRLYSTCLVLIFLYIYSAVVVVGFDCFLLISPHFGCTLLVSYHCRLLPPSITCYTYVNEYTVPYTTARWRRSHAYWSYRAHTTLYFFIPLGRSNFL